MIMGTRALFRKRRGWVTSKKLGFSYAGGKRLKEKKTPFPEETFFGITLRCSASVLGVDGIAFQWQVIPAASAQADRIRMII